MCGKLRPTRPSRSYWETYGLRAGVERHVHYRVRLGVRDAGGRPLPATLIRSVGAALGFRQTDDQALEWEVQRSLATAVAPDLLLLTAPDDEGQYRIEIEVTDAVDGRIARTERLIQLAARD
jgi:hypothetical protein